MHSWIIGVTARVKGSELQRVQLPPENWFARPGSRAFFNSTPDFVNNPAVFCFATRSRSAWVLHIW